MSLFALIPIIVLVVVAAGSCALVAALFRARARRRMLAASRSLACDAPEGFGISVLCSGIDDLQEIEALLSTEYARFEAVIVLDAVAHPELFAAIVARYRMIRVERLPEGEGSLDGVRGMGRSRKRCFRRLVLLDRAADTPEGDFAAAAAAASYAYVLPLRGGQRLMPDAVERLAAHLGCYPPARFTLVRSWIGAPLVLAGRDAVVAAGGFGRRLMRHVPRRKRAILWEPFFVPRPPGRLRRWGEAAAGLVLAASVAASALAGRWALCALLLTVALVWSAAICAATSVRDVGGPPATRLAGWPHPRPRV